MYIYIYNIQRERGERRREKRTQECAMSRANNVRAAADAFRPLRTDIYMIYTCKNAKLYGCKM